MTQDGVMIGQIDEKRLREKIADEIKKSFMPICRCERCGTEQIGYLIENIIDAIKGNK